MKPRLVDAAHSMLCNEPQSGADIAEYLGSSPEEVFEALVWMEARDYAALRPIGASRRYSFYGWVTGRRSLEVA
jgi:hypothetical protein